MNNLLNQIIKDQKQELEGRLSFKYVPRTIFARAKKLADSDLIKVIIGPRRAGKSILAMLLLEGSDFAYLNFDESPLLEEVKRSGTLELLKELFAVYGNAKTLFFDEIQNLDQWELFANKLHREGYNVFLTGSNAKLLSQDLATHLTGRHFRIEVFPFDFKEYLAGKEFNENIEELSTNQKGELLNHLENYLINGGYPETVVKDLDNKKYLSELFDSAIFKDVVKKYKIRFPQKIDTVGSIIINNVGNELSYRKLAKSLNLKSSMTAEKYAKLLEESYIIFLLEKYSNKTGERVGGVKKSYVVDNGFIRAKAVQFSSNKGKLMENLAFVELLKRGYRPNLDLFYYKTKNKKEVDFMVRKGIKVDSLIQVAYDTSVFDTDNREVSALVEASNEVHCDNLILITWDKEETKKIKGKEIKYIPLWKWLLS